MSTNRPVCKNAVALAYYGSCRLLVMGSRKRVICMSHALKVLLFISLCNSLLENSLNNSQLAYTTQVNSTFRARWLASSEVISQVLFTSEQPKRNKMASRKRGGCTEKHRNGNKVW